MGDDHSIGVLVVDDSAFMRRAIQTMLSRQEGLTVLGAAQDGLEAVEACQRLQPDVVTLDIEMPRMDGLTALRQIKRVCRASVLMVSSLTTAGSVATFSALRSGADDFIAKDLSQVSLDIVKIESDLVAKVRQLGIVSRTRATVPKTIAVSSCDEPPKLRASHFDVVLIGSSTGGPPVLESILTALPAEFPLPVLVAQHMPLLFTRTMAQRLDEVCAMKVEHAAGGMRAEPGCVYIAPGGNHLRLRGLLGGVKLLEVSPRPTEALYKPSVNELFASAAKACAARCLAVVLTGMGDDGLEGGRTLHAAGGTILAQEPNSCVVYGMPRAVSQAGLITASLTPTQIAETLCCMSSRAAA